MAKTGGGGGGGFLCCRYLERQVPHSASVRNCIYCLKWSLIDSKNCYRKHLYVRRPTVGSFHVWTVCCYRGHCISWYGYLSSNSMKCSLSRRRSWAILHDHIRIYLGGLRKTTKVLIQVVTVATGVRNGNQKPYKLPSRVRMEFLTLLGSGHQKPAWNLSVPNVK
jgi:hypothetical protein